MKFNFKILAAAAMIAATVSCASVEKMAKMAENVEVTCNPGVLEVANGAIDADVAVTYPADYFNPKAILEVTPVIVYDGGEVRLSPLMYQGEKVKDNYKVVSSDGQTVKEHLHFDYVPGMEQSHLELRGVARKGERYVNLPVKKVADGANTTYMLVKDAGTLAFKKDNYQDVIPSTTEGQIKYLVNSAEVRNSELKGKSVKDFLSALDKINADERTTLTGTEIVAYASPDGGEELNDKDHFAYIIGYEDETVRPNNQITRAEVATIFFRLLTDEVREANMTRVNPFSDVSEGQWYNNAISTMAAMGVVTGYPDGTFRPDQPITRAESMALINRMLDRDPAHPEVYHYIYIYYYH